MKSELKVNSSTIYEFNDQASFEGKDGQQIKFISIRKIKFNKGEDKPKFQNLTISHKDREAVYAWLRKCLS